MNMDSVGRTVHPLVYLPLTPFFPFSMNKTGRSTRDLPLFFFILHVPTIFHYDQTNENVKPKNIVRSPEG